MMNYTKQYDVIVNGRMVKLTPNANAADEGCTRYCAPRSAGQIRTENRLGVFSADDVCAAALVYALQSGESGHAVVMVESCGAEGPIPVVVNQKSGHVTIRLPLPEIREPVDGVRHIAYPGLRCYVGEHVSDVPDAETPALLVCRNSDCSKVTVQLLAEKGLPPVELDASGLAAAAAVIDYAATFPDGVSECGVGMNGGDLEVGVSVRNGAVLGLSVCSVLRLAREKE